MRRPFVLLLAVLSVTVAGEGIALSSSSASQRVIVCPVVRGVIIPSCGPPVMSLQQPSGLEPNDCCPDNALCAMGLTIGSTPNPSRSTGSVVISGRILGRGPATANPVVLWQRLSGQRQFKRMLQTTPGAGGSYSITRAAGGVQTNRQWYVGAGALRSSTITQQVHALVALAGSFASGQSPNAIALTGRVSPSHARELITIERRSGGHWKALAHARLNRHSRYKLKLTPAVVRSVVLRAVLPADSRNVGSASAPVKIGVVPSRDGR